MFTPDGKLGSRSEHERLLQRRVLEEARALFQVHGGAALRTARDVRSAASNTPDERRYDRLVIVELERLDREARRAAALVRYRTPSVWRQFLDRLRCPSERR